MLYVESSALMKLYRPEAHSEFTLQTVRAESVPFTCRLTEIEVRRNFVRHFDGEALAQVQRQLQVDLEQFVLVDLDAEVCSDAARIAEETLCRSLDAIHLAAARRVGSSVTVLTFDRRQAQAARAIGLAVLGA